MVPAAIEVVGGVGITEQVPFLGAFSVGIARERPRLLRITAPSSNARMICGAFV
jgi:hypothetical protein